MFWCIKSWEIVEGWFLLDGEKSKLNICSNYICLRIKWVKERIVGEVLVVL